ncbi:flap endonuclease-1 [Candidatus Woesearchaeota archaeon]|nr:flap endonuclease-1 [Candidatus Woesearchaeota archaeon]
MGTNLKDLLVMDEISIDKLKNKVLAVDSFNVLYQFLTTIRQRDGTPLKDSKGRITSHLTGLFNRTTRLMKEGLKLVFVFDGKPPELKAKERERRFVLKQEALKQYKKAAKKKDIEAMKKYAARTSRLTGDMVDESKELIRALGLPVVQAPSEGEAQVAFIVGKGDAYAGISEDYDSLLYGVPKLIKNLTISGRRKFGAAYVTVKPKIISLSKNLNSLGIDNDQLIVLAMLVGTDYNPGGVKGIGPKTALKLVKEHKHDFDMLFDEAKWKEHVNIDWKDIYYLIKKMPVKKDYKLEWGKVNKEKLYKMLVEEHDFSEERVENALKALVEADKKKQQKGLGDWVK